MTTRTTIPPLVAIVLYFAVPALYALSVAYLPPLEAVGKATDIAVGLVQVSHGNSLEVRFQPTQVLKGSLKINKLYRVDYVDDSIRATLKPVLEKIAAYAEGKPAVLFLGYLHTDGETLVPNSMDGAVWPRNTSAPLVQTPDTLEECITFVKVVMANPNIKLKNVNGRRVLPDHNPLPESTVAPKADSKATVPVPSPSPAVPNVSRPTPAVVPPAKNSATLWAAGTLTIVGTVWLWLKCRRVRSG